MLFLYRNCFLFVCFYGNFLFIVLKSHKVLVGFNSWKMAGNSSFTLWLFHFQTLTELRSEQPVVYRDVLWSWGPFYLMFSWSGPGQTLWSRFRIPLQTWILYALFECSVELEYSAATLTNMIYKICIAVGSQDSNWNVTERRRYSSVKEALKSCVSKNNL